MGLSIEICRIRIGSHNNFVQARQSMKQIKAIFWNHMLVMFYLEIFYLPCLKNLVTKIQNNNEVCMWYTQMVFYHVYVLLLLRLANDVEKKTQAQLISMILVITVLRFEQTSTKVIYPCLE
jgi:hypothetical protein